MKRKYSFKILTVVVLAIILVILINVCVSTINENNNKTSYEMIYKKNQKTNNQLSSIEVENTKILNATGQVISALEDKIELHSTYYLQEIYIEENSELKEGDNILQYTNGTYLTAPYDCIITKLNIPQIGEICSNEHYIEIESVNQLAIKLNIDENIINKISIGQETKIQLTAIENKTYEGNITKISSTASNGKFTVVVEFQNDGNIKIGMSAEVEI